MPEPFSAERLNQLRQSWERDPKSRAFLQLAEEYRRARRLADAIHVLEAGLAEHPTYLSAQVALGRCLLENGSPGPAIELLGRALARDPMQLVANKLLVEAYLATGQATQARERLDLYKLFNDRDAAIEPLEARIRAQEERGKGPSAETKSSARGGFDEAALFALPPVAGLPAVRFEPSTSQRPRPVGSARSEPFGRLYAAAAARRIAAAFSEAGIFPLPSAASRPETESPPTPPMFPLAPTAPVFETVSADDLAFGNRTGIEAEIEAGIAPPDDVPAAVPADVWQPEALPPPAAAPQPAVSATLGELYLAQGHLAEAEESFAAVLHDRPGDAAALAGLQSVRLQRGDEAEAFSEAPVVAAEPSLVVGGLTARKAALLKDYLARIRQGAKRHVS